MISTLDRYLADRTVNNRNAVVEQYQHLVRGCAIDIASGLRPTITADELMADGCIGLIRAVESYSVDRLVPFEPYAILKIRWAIRESIRKLLPIPRGLYPQIVRNCRFREQFAKKHGRPPSDKEVSLANAEIVGLLKSAPQSGRGFCFDEIVGYDDQVNQYDNCQLAESLLEKLSSQPRAVVWLKYMHNMSMQSIGTALGLSTSRVIDIHDRAIVDMRAWAESESLDSCTT